MRLTMRCCKKQMKGADNRGLKNKIHSPTDFTDYTNLFEAKKICVICEICGTMYAYWDLTYGTPLRPSENLDFLLFITVLRAYKAL